jgi:hypothetical protein
MVWALFSLSVDSSLLCVSFLQNPLDEGERESEIGTQGTVGGM